MKAWSSDFSSLLIALGAVILALSPMLTGHRIQRWFDHRLKVGHRLPMGLGAGIGLLVGVGIVASWAWAG